MPETLLFKRMYEREREARKRAEHLLEDMSMELYNAYTQLKLSSEDLFTIFRSVADGIVKFDANGKIEMMNPAFEKIFAVPKSLLVGRYIQSLLPVEESRSVQQEEFWVHRCTEAQPKFSTRGVNGRGQEFDMELSASRATQPSKSGGSGSVFYVWVVRNTQHLRNVERKLAVSQRLEAIGQLAAGVSHEINTPIQYVHENTTFLRDAFEGLNAVVGGIERALEDPGQTREQLNEAFQALREQNNLDFYREEIDKAIQEALHGSNRVISIVRAIKEFAHPGTNEKARFNLNHAIASAVTVSSNHWRSHCTIQTKLAPDLPEVLCHPAEINQVILNLLVNACDAIAEKMDRQGIVADPERSHQEGIIEFKTWRDGNSVKLSVRDTGIGIKPENLERIYTLFYTTKAVGKGTGQGLAIVHSIVVEQHGGSIDVASEPGKGTTFTITIPIGEP
ncbi:MAG: ATP-binding protein [Pirellula sp.]